jgi:hypothetical protein
MLDYERFRKFIAVHIRIREPTRKRPFLTATTAGGLKRRSQRTELAGTKSDESEQKALRKSLETRIFSQLAEVSCKDGQAKTAAT